MPTNDTPLFNPEPHFAEEWFIDDPLAQGAMKHASITILDALNEAMEEISKPDPDFDSLYIFPEAFHLALTPNLIDNVRCAAIIMGWKLAQPGDPIVPGCLAEELALEMIRREATVALELEGAPESSMQATYGVFEICEDDDVLDLFNMEEPADASVALSDPVNIQMGKADMRPEAWFKPFYGGQGHPVYSEMS